MQVQIVAAIAFLLATGIVGIRLLVLARRTGGQPELLMGLGFCSLVFVYLPARAYSGLGRVTVGDLHLEVLGVASLFLWSGITCQILFIWRAFRPGERWAFVLSGVLSCVTAGIIAAMVIALYTSGPEVHSHEAAQPWIVWIRLPLILCYVWTGVEGFHQYLQSKRRVVFGLGNPVVTNRFLLWGMFGFTHASLFAADLMFQMAGSDLMNSPGAMAVMVTGSAIATIVMLLVFFPPTRYVEFVRRRANVVVA